MENTSLNSSVLPRVPKPYPTHGVIGNTPRSVGWLDLGNLHRYETIRETADDANTMGKHCRRKVDIEDSSMFCKSPLCPKPDINHLQLVPDFNDGKSTSEWYHMQQDLPSRFEHPEKFKGYGVEQKIHPFYMTTSSQYGFYPPNVHTMPFSYKPIHRDKAFGDSGKTNNRYTSININ